ncbi:MAG: peptide deformylase [Candidatus Saccharimonadales bacterium]
MKKEDIIKLPHSSLRQRSKKVGIVTSDIHKLILDMESATLDWEASRDHEVGVALAAVQVNALLRIVVIRNNIDDKNDRSFGVFINPEITKYEGNIIEDYEGCLSIKDIYGKVPRYEKVRIRATNEKGHQIRTSAEGFMARIFQHEIDHTNGKVFIDHIKDDPEAFYILDNKGHLEALDYEKDIKNNKKLWS